MVATSSSAPLIFSATLSNSSPSSSRHLIPLPVRHGAQPLHHQILTKIWGIIMPVLSSTMTEGKIVSWVKAEGDRLSKGESVVVVESDKADMDVEAFYDSILTAIIVPEGEIAPVGAPIGLLIESEDEVPITKAQS